MATDQELGPRNVTGYTIHLQPPLTHLVPQVKGTQIKGRGGGEREKEESRLSKHEGALNLLQSPAPVIAPEPRPYSSIPTATQHCLLYSALPKATLRQATEEGHPGGTAGG